MDFFNELMSRSILLGVIISVLQLVSAALFLVFMHFSAEHRNKDLSVSWYIFGFLFPLLTGIVFLVKRKKFPGASMKVCPICGDKYPEVYEVCGRCLVELPANDEVKKKKQAKIARVCGILFIIIYIALEVVVGAYIVKTFSWAFSMIGEAFESDRIAVVNEEGDKVYYDKMGNSYEDPYDVVIYDKKGNTYKYYADEEAYEYWYVRDDGEKFDSYSCYVDEDGFFYYDKDYELFYPEEEYDYEDETYSYDEDIALDEIMTELENYKYYESYCVDSDGNIYYWAEEASWNADGELITAENDPTIAE